jgi:hypothetical protein
MRETEKQAVCGANDQWIGGSRRRKMSTAMMLDVFLLLALVLTYVAISYGRTR